MKILYLVVTYNPSDRNPEYTSLSGFPYRNLRSVRDMVKYSSHEVTVAVVDCASGEKSRDVMRQFKRDEFKSLKLAFGPDLSSYQATNLAIARLGCQFDQLFYSVSDVIVESPSEFDETVASFNSDPKCLMLYLQAEPGLCLPGGKIKDQWFSKMPMHSGVHHNCHAVKRQWVDFYDGRLFMDIFDSSCVEPYMGYLCHAQGGYRKISRTLRYKHLCNEVLRDRRSAHSHLKNKVRGDSHFAPTPRLKRDIEQLIAGAASAGAVFDRAVSTGIPDVADVFELPPKSQARMAKAIRKHLFLTPKELDYGSLQMEIE